MYTEQSLMEELIKKLKNEQKEYLDELKAKGVDEVLKNVYEINARNEIVDYISYKELDSKVIRALLNENKILYRMYDEWLSYDGNFYEALEYPIDKEIERISDDFYGKNDRNNTSKEKESKNKNMSFER